MALKKHKSYKLKEDAFRAKNGLPFSWWTNWHRANLGSKLPFDRHWIFVFTKPATYKHKSGEKPWYAQVCIWDTYEEVWLNKFLFQETVGSYKSLSRFVYDTNHNILVAVYAKSIAVFEFYKPQSIFEYELENEIPEAEAFNWHMPDYNTITLYDSKGLWYEMTLNRGNRLGMINIFRPNAISPRVFLDKVHIIHVEETPPDGILTKCRFIVLITRPIDSNLKCIVILKRDRTNTDHIWDKREHGNREVSHLRRRYSPAMYLDAVIEDDINTKEIIVENNILKISDIVSIPVERLGGYWD